MSINPITGVIAGIQQNNLTRTGSKLQAAIASLVSGAKSVRASDDVAGLAQAVQMQNALGGLRQASTNISQAGSLVEVADQGIGSIANILDRMRELAVQSGSGALSNDARKGLNIEFQSLVQEITRTAQNTTFGGKSLLDGTLSGDGALKLSSVIAEDVEGVDANDALSIDDLSSNALFQGKSLDISNAKNAQDAIAAIAQAAEALASTRADVGSFQQELDFASANFASAIFNQDAARSVLTDADFGEASTQFSLANLQQNVQVALAAQAKKLPPSMLTLIE